MNLTELKKEVDAAFATDPDAEVMVKGDGQSEPATSAELQEEAFVIRHSGTGK